MLPVPNAEKIDNRDEQPGAGWDGVSVGQKLGRGYLVLKRLVGLKSS